MSAIAFPDPHSVAAKIAAFGDPDLATLKLLMENPVQDDNLINGLHSFLDDAANARILNSLRLEKAGAWFGDHAPARLQIRLMEIARSSQHAAFLAFKSGLSRSGGLEKAWPKA